MDETPKNETKNPGGFFAFLKKILAPKPFLKNAEELAKSGLPEEPQQETPPPPPKIDTRMPAAKNQVYLAYCRVKGKPIPEGEAEFDAAILHTEECEPSQDSIAAIKSLEKNAASMLEKWAKAQPKKPKEEKKEPQKEGQTENPNPTTNNEAQSPQDQEPEAKAETSAIVDTLQQPPPQAEPEPEPEPVEAEAVAIVSKNKMQAFLFVFPPMFGAKDITKEQLDELFKKEKIVYGIDEEMMNMLVDEKKYMKIIPIAQGLAPIDGIPGRVVDHFSRGKEICLTVKEDNTIDYRDLGWLQTVNEQDVVCEIIKPVPPVGGFDVFGREIKGKEARAAAVPNGKGTVLNPDGTMVLSTLGGVISFASDRFQVDPLLIIGGNLDISVGNLDVVGDVLVKGDVQEGFVLNATGNITVNGCIEGATVKAGGNVQIGLGMNGNSIGSINAGGDVYSKFLENTKVYALGSIICDTAINSEISSEKEVLVRTGRGVIIGGAVTALTRIAANSIGNISNRHIDITLGNTKKYLQQKKEMEDLRQLEIKAIESLTKDIQFLEKQKDSPIKKEKLGELNLQLTMRRLRQGKLEKDYEDVLLREADIAKCRLQAEALYPPATITMGRDVMYIRKNNFNVLLYYKDGEIHIGNV